MAIYHASVHPHCNSGATEETDNPHDEDTSPAVDVVTWTVGQVLCCTLRQRIVRSRSQRACSTIPGIPSTVIMDGDTRWSALNA